MAPARPHPRRLYPYPPNPATCATTCTPACDFYLLCPPLPPPPPPAPATTVHLHSSRLPLPLLVLSSSLLALSLLLLLALLLSILRRLCRRRRERSATTNQPPPVDVAGEDNNEEGGLAGDDGGVHHVWYIRTVGLDERAIAAITALVYKGGGASNGGGGCAVCLAEFRDGETLRLLPKCGHLFHRGCIDTWLRAHVNCPLCRAPVTCPPQVEEAPVAEASEGSFRQLDTIDDHPEHEEEWSLRVVRRAASMGSVPVLFDGGSGSKSGHEDDGEGGKMETLSKISVELEAVGVERSVSFSGASFFLTRYGRARGSVLPAVGDMDEISR